VINRIKFVLLLVLFVGSSRMFSQELNCTITINSQQAQGSDKRIFETLRNSLMEFMNNTKWTQDNFKQEERIECSFTITITSRKSINDFDAGLVVQSRRPTYRTNYSSLLMSHNDPDFSFSYVEFQPLEFQENTFSNNLTALMGFYAYIILGLDYDSFAPEGGSPYFQKALTIVNNAQNTAEKGWKAFEGNKNRYWLADGYTNGNYKAIRQTMYKYHRKGLDIMATDIDNARLAISESIENLKIVHNLVPGSYLMQTFFWAKADEIVNIYKEAPSDQKNKIFTALSIIDPGNGQKYQKLQQ